MTATEPGFYDDLDEAMYHAHPTSLSVSGAKVLLKAPALFQWQRTHPVHKDVFDVGSAAHKLVLGVGDPIRVIDADSWRTKAAQEAKAAAREAGEIPLLTADHQRVQNMADALSSNTLAMELLSEGKPEVSAFAEDETTGVLRRCRFDFLGPTIASDYKSSISADPADFGRTAMNFGYDMQDAYYSDIARDLGHPLKAFAYLVQMKEPPYLSSVVELDADSRQRGRERNERALEIYRDCVAAGKWPGFQADGTFSTVRLPPWAFREEWSA